jgi:hypothetical protein
MKRMIVLLSLLFAIGPVVVHSQGTSTYDCFYVKQVKVSRLRGRVLDQQGKPVSGAHVELLKRGAGDALANTTTDADGTFQFNEPGGQYWVQVNASGFEMIGLNVRVNHGLFSFFNARNLYLVLAVGGTAKPCPAEITSRKKLQEYIRDNATQK